MRLPLELIIVIVIARLYAPEAGEKLPELAPGTLLWTVSAIVVGCSFLYFIALAGSAWSVHRLRAGPAERARVYDVHSRIVVAEQVLLVAAYLVLADRTGWPALAAGARMTVIGDDLLQILPFLLGSLAIWLANYPASRALSPARWGLGEYLRNQARGVFFLLGPWLVMMAAHDSHIYWPEPAAELYANSVAAQLGAYAAVLLAMVVLFPLYMVRLWPHRRLPAGAVRGRLEALLERARVRCRDLVVWSTGRGRIANAAVMGPVPWTRYIVFTDALLEDLDESEVEAVLAHELGHVRHHHMGFYMLFILAFLLFGMLIVSMLPDAVQASKWLMGMLIVALMVFCWRGVFGFLSRRFERQADVASCELVGGPRPLMSALEKLARASGGSRASRNWRHYSVAERVAYLARFGFDKEALKEYHSYVRLVKGVAVVIVLLLAVSLGRKDELWFSQGLEAKERELIEHLEENPHEHEKWAQLGQVQMNLGKYPQAWESFEKAKKTHGRFYPDGYLGLAEISMRSDSGEYFSYKKAVEFAEEAVQRCERPEHRKKLIYALTLLAKAARHAENHDLAVRSLRKALERDPNNKELAERLKVARAAAKRGGKEAKPPKGSPQSETSSD